MILLASIFLILFEAIPEGLSLRGLKAISGILEFVYRAIVTLIVFAWLINYQIFQITYDSLFYFIGGYLLLRFAIFDVVFNLCAGLPLIYIGTTKLYDMFWQWVFKVTKIPINHFFVMVKFIALLIGITWLLK